MWNDKFKAALEEYFKSDENQRDVAVLINNAFDKFTKSEVKEVIAKLDKDEISGNIEEISAVYNQ